MRHSILRPPVLLLSSASLLLPLLASGSAAQSYRLNDPFPAASLYTVDAYRLSADGTHVVYVAGERARTDHTRLFGASLDGITAPLDLTPVGILPGLPLLISDPQITPDGSRVLCLYRDLRTRLYSVPLQGGAGVVLSRNATVTRDVLSFRITADGLRVVYLADEDTNEVFELYSLPVDGGAPAVQLNSELPQGGDVLNGFELSPDGSRVVYRTRTSANGIDLHSAPVDGSSPSVRLSLPRPLTSVEADFRIAFDSLGVVYRADQDTNDVPELYAVRIDGASPPAKRNGPLVAGGRVTTFELSRVSDRLIYLANQEQPGFTELYSTRAIIGGVPTKLNGALVSGGDVREARLSADASFAVYLAVQDSPNVVELFGAPSNGSAPAVKLHSSLTVPAQSVTAFALAPAGERVLFASGGSLHSTHLGGGPALLLDGSPVGGSVREIQGVLADGTVLYTCDREVRERIELYRIPADGSGGPLKVNAPFHSGEIVRTASATADASRIVYHAGPDLGPATELFVAPGAGGRVRRFAVPMGAPYGLVEAFRLSAQGSRVVYQGNDKGFPSYSDLFSVPTDGSRSPRRLNPPMSASAFINGFAISPDEARVVYTLWQPASGSVELHSTPIDSARDVRLDTPLVPDLHIVLAFAITPDSTRVVYLAEQGTPHLAELFIRPLDGSQPAVRLHPPLGSQQSIQDFALSPDGAWAVYVVSELAGRQLYSLPLDGHQAPVRLNAPLVSGGSVGGDQDGAASYRFRIAPDSSRVVYLADQDTDDVTELYSVPIDGSLGPTKLNGPQVGGRGIVVDPLAPLGLDPSQPYWISPNGLRVVYRADQDTHGRAELYSVPIDGSAPAIRVSGVLLAGGVVRRFAIDPSSTRVVYEANADDPAQVELYSAPLGGGAAAVKLNGTLVAGGDVASGFDYGGPLFRFGAQGRVVYAADQDVDELVELFGVPIDGSAAPVRLSGALAPGGEVAVPFELSADGGSVIFAADALQDDLVELFSAPLDASRPPQRISGPMVPGGSVLLDHGFLVSPDGERVVYRARQNSPLSELYAGFLSFTRGPRGSGAPTRSVTR